MTTKDEIEDAERSLTFLASMPTGSATVTTAGLRHLLLRTGGWILACGASYDITPTLLGAGVYRLTLTERT